MSHRLSITINYVLRFKSRSDSYFFKMGKKYQTVKLIFLSYVQWNSEE